MSGRAKRGTGDRITITWKNHLSAANRTKGGLYDWRTTWRWQRARCFSPAVDGRRGKGVWAYAGGLMSYHRTLKGAQEAATSRLVRAARQAQASKAAKLSASPKKTFDLYAVQGTVPTEGAVWFRSLSRSHARREAPWLPTIEGAKLYNDVGEARAQRTKLLRSHPQMAPICVVKLIVSLGEAVSPN